MKEFEKFKIILLLFKNDLNERYYKIFNYIIIIIFHF